MMALEVQKFILSNGNRTKLADYIGRLRQINKTTVIDIGPSLNFWSKDIIDAYVDCTKIQFDAPKKEFIFDITDYDSWKPLEDYVEKNGKFGFSICSHTLEDITDPRMVAKKLSKIAKGGFVSFPSKYFEFTKNLDEYQTAVGSYRGYIHHKWIFTFQEGKLYALPKANFTEIDYFNKYSNPRSDIFDLSFIWKDNLEINYLDIPSSPMDLFEKYKYILEDDDCDAFVRANKPKL